MLTENLGAAHRAASSGFEDALVTRYAGFAGWLRANDFRVTTSDIAASMEVAERMGQMDSQLLRWSLRAVLCSRAEEWRRFDDLFGSREWKGRVTKALHLESGSPVAWKDLGNHLHRAWPNRAQARYPKAILHRPGFQDETSVPFFIEPGEVEDFAAHSVLLDFTCSRDKPAIPYVGTAIRQECALDDAARTITEVPSCSLLSRLTDPSAPTSSHRLPAPG